MHEFKKCIETYAREIQRCSDKTHLKINQIKMIKTGHDVYSIHSRTFISHVRVLSILPQGYTVSKDEAKCPRRPNRDKTSHV